MDKIDRMKKRITAIGLTCMVGWAGAYLAIDVYKDYVYGLFVWLPFVMGFITSSIYGYKNPASYKMLWNLSMLALGIFCLGMLTFAWEGVICLLMAAPIGIGFNSLGSLLGYRVIKSSMKKNIPTICILLLLSVPSLMSFENSVNYSEELRSVTTNVDINASPEVVWKNVIEFPKLEPPKELIFKTGIAYPISAEIDGQGVGAVRHCNFSTGSFVEPITVWDEPRLLKFSVKDQPEPMKELSFYDIHPNHLHGYWISKEGQFKLTALPNGHTLLEGTTWYVNKIKPGFYWTMWSDYIVHKIHERVLEQIKENAEKSI